MEDFQSKYTGEQVEQLLDQVANGETGGGEGGGGGGITVETDPVFLASPAASITEEKKAEWDNKVDKVSGKQLSTEDFTSELEGKLKGIEANAQKNVQSDWNENDRASDAYVNNRTHYSYDIEPIASFSLASKNEGDILVTGLNEGAFYKFYGSKSDTFYFVVGRKVIIPAYGPTIEAICAYEDGFCLKLTTPTYGLTESFDLVEIHVEQLDDVYIPETIARKDEILQGEKGEQGEQGPKGDKGDKGDSGAYQKVTTDLTDAVLHPNAVTEWVAPISAELALSFAEQPDQGYAAEYIARFSVGADGVQLIVPDGVVWADGVLPAMTNGKTYEISFVDNLATFLEF